MNRYPPWSDDDVAHLIKMHGNVRSMTYREIGATMPNGPRSKNSVISQANRMGLRQKDRPSEHLPVAAPKKVARSSPKESGCKYPLGKIGSKDFRYCDVDVSHEGSDWCPDCRKIIFKEAVE